MQILIEMTSRKPAAIYINGQESDRTISVYLCDLDNNELTTTESFDTYSDNILLTTAEFAEMLRSKNAATVEYYMAMPWQYIVAQQPDGGWQVSVPQFRNLRSRGPDLAETVALTKQRLVEAISCHIECNEPIPAPEEE